MSANQNFQIKHIKMQTWFLLLLSLVLSAFADDTLKENATRINFLNTTAIGEKEADMILKLEKLLSDGEDVVNLEGHKKVIAIIGMSGTGKSTFKKLYLKEPNLRVVRANNVSNKFLFSDGGIQISTLKDAQRSKTLVPNTAVDPVSGAIIVDCPGFDDTRGVAEDIAASYMMKRVLDKAEQIKFIVMETNAGFSHGGDRYTIRKMLRHLSKFFPDVNRLNGSIALIENKTPRLPSSTNEGEEYDVMQALDNFKTALMTTPKEIINAGTFLSTKDIEKMIELIDIFNYGAGDNIAVIYMPNKEGSPWDIDYMNESHAQLKDLVENKLNFSDNVGVEYGYSISAESLSFIKDYLLPFKTQELEKVALVVMDNLKDQVLRKLKLERIQKKFELITFFIDNVSKANFSSYNEFIEFIDTSGFPVEENVAKKLINIEGVCQFYNHMARVPQNRSLLLHVQNSIETKFVHQLTEIKTFYKFLSKLEAGLQNFEAHFNRDSFKRSCKIQEGISSLAEFESLVLHLNQLKVDVPDTSALLSIKTISKEMFVELSLLLKNNLDYEVDFSYNEQSKELGVRGRTLILSQALSQKRPDTRSIKIFAWETLFLDGNVQHLTDTNLAMFAPFIKVVVPSVISSIASPAGDAQAGKNSGYIFMGALEVQNPSRLSLETLGGKGGKGKIGSDSSCRFPTAPSVYFPSEISYSKIYSRIASAQFSYQDIDSKKWKSDDDEFFHYRSYYHEVIIKVIDSAYTTQAASHGGPGGRGGNPGNVYVKIKNTPTIKISKSPGTDGPTGDPGRIITCYQKKAFNIYKCTEKIERNPFARTKGGGYNCYSQTTGYDETGNDVVLRYLNAFSGTSAAKSQEPVEIPYNQLISEYAHDSKSMAASTLDFISFIQK